MRVICVNAGAMPSDAVAEKNAPWELVEGETYTVIDSFVADGYCWYVIEEDPFNTDGEYELGFDSQRFDNLKNTDAAVEEAVRVIELTKPKKKNWLEKIFS